MGGARVRAAAAAVSAAACACRVPRSGVRSGIVDDGDGDDGVGDDGGLAPGSPWRKSSG